MSKSIVFLIFIGLAALVISSCSSPTTENQSTSTIASNEITDITESSSASLGDESTEPKTEDMHEKIVSTANQPKIPVQFEASMKVIENMKKQTVDNGEKDYAFDIGERAFLGGNKLVENGGEITPIPIYKTWDTTKILTVEDVISWGANSAIIEITGKRKSDMGNWYMIKLKKGGFDDMSGWVPEDLLISLASAGETNIKPGASRPEDGGGRGGRGGGGDGGGGG